MTYREEVEQALEYLSTAVEAYVDMATGIPEDRRKDVLEAFATVTRAAESSVRYAERMMLLERRLRAVGKICAGEPMVEVEPPSRKDLVVVLDANDARFLVRDLLGESKLVSKPAAVARDAVARALKEHEQR